jgi:hypothetical protein
MFYFPHHLLPSPHPGKNFFELVETGHSRSTDLYKSSVSPDICLSPASSLINCEVKGMKTLVYHSPARYLCVLSPRVDLTRLSWIRRFASVYYLPVGTNVDGPAEYAVPFRCIVVSKWLAIRYKLYKVIKGSWFKRS